MGKNRSPTAASVAADIASERGLDVEISYGAIDFLIVFDSPSDRNMNMYTEHFKQYDRIFVMERYMEEGLEKKLGVEPRKVVCMNIPDEYPRNDPILLSILRNSLGVLM